MGSDSKGNVERLIRESGDLDKVGGMELEALAKVTGMEEEPAKSQDGATHRDYSQTEEGVGSSIR